MTNERRAAIVVAALILSNVHDAVATLYILKSGPAVGMEFNPLLAWLYANGGSTAFLVFKFGYLAMVAPLFWFNRDRPSILTTTVVVTGIYLALAVVELGFLFLHWRVF